MRQENSSRLFEYWNRLRGERQAPERSEIEPSDIREILGDTFILEVSERMRTIAYRLAGTRLCAAYGRELKGLGYLALWDEDRNFEVAKAVRAVHRDYQPVVVSYRAATQDGKFLDFESILLPLLPVADGNARILGLAAPREVPYWFGAEPLVVNRLRHVRQVEVTPPTPPLAPEIAPQPQEKAKSRRVAHLTVLNGGRDSN